MHQQVEAKKQKFLVLENLNTCLHDNFWVAFDALEFKNAETLLVKGIAAAKQLQEAIIRQGCAIIEKKEVKVAGQFRYVMLENDYLADIKLFQFPLALEKLGMFIQQDYKETNKKAQKEKPLVISVKNTKKGTTLVIAVMAQNQQEGRK